MKRRNFFHCFGLGLLGAILPYGSSSGSEGSSNISADDDWERAFDRININTSYYMIEFNKNTKDGEMTYIYHTDPKLSPRDTGQEKYVFACRKMYNNKSVHQSIKNRKDIHINGLCLKIALITYNPTGEPSIG